MRGYQGGTSTRLIVLGITFVAVVLQAQVRELWRTGLTNSFQPAAFYQLREAAVDSDGNTIVGGGFSDSVAGTSSTAGFVAKFDSAGRKIWEARLGTNTVAVFDALGVDALGNIYAAIRFDPFGDNRVLTLIKLSPAGTELWRWVDTDILRATTASDTGSALKVDSAGNSTIMTLRARGEGSGVTTEQVLARISPAGVALWQTTLPGEHYFLVPESDSRTLALTGAGGVVVAGMYSVVPPSATIQPRAFAAKLNANGELEWWTDEAKQADPPLFYSSVVVRQTICAAGDGATVFSKNGNPLHADPAVREVFDVDTRQGFLVMRSGQLALLNPTGGHLRWSIGLRLFPQWNVVSDQNGFLAVGGTAPFPRTGLGFVAVSETGEELWRTEFPGYGLVEDPSGNAPRHQVFRATDGTLRVVAPFQTLGITRGITVAAFQEE